MTYERMIVLAMDYLTGTSIEALAVRENLSVQRIYQILNKLTKNTIGLHSIAHVKHIENGATRFMNLLRSRSDVSRYIENATTPEEFYHELLREPRTRNFD